MIRTFIGIATAALALAQTPAFEVASIRPHEGVIRQVGRSTSGPMVTVTANTVRELIIDSFDVRGFQVDGATRELSIYAR